MKLYQVFDLSFKNGTWIDALQKINSFTDVGEGGVIGLFILIVIFGPLFLIMRTYGNERAFAVAGLITGIISIFLRIFGLINDYVLYACIILSVIGIVLLLKDAANYEN